MDYTVAAVWSAVFLDLFPRFIQPYEALILLPTQLTQPLSLIGNRLTHVKAARRKAEQFIVPIIEERYQLPPEERPNDMLTWLMEDAVGEEKDPRNLTLRVLVINFAAIHTTSTVSYPRLTLKPALA